MNAPSVYRFIVGQTSEVTEDLGGREVGTSTSEVFGDLGSLHYRYRESIRLASRTFCELADTWPPELNDQPPAGRKVAVAAPAHPGSAGDYPGLA